MSIDKNIGYREEKLARYIAEHSKAEDPLLKSLSRETHVKIYHPRRSSDRFSGQFLGMISFMIRPQKILEIGTFTGYGAISLARGLAPGGILHTIEINDELEKFTRGWIKKSGLDDRVILHIGNALEIIPKLDEIFDLVFIDGEKDQYTDYYKTVLPKVRNGGFILADNALWSGKVIDGDIPARDHFTWGIRKFNKTVQEDEKVENLLLPVYDGLMVIRKK